MRDGKEGGKEENISKYIYKFLYINTCMKIE